jgi:hypothetical protein
MHNVWRCSRPCERPHRPCGHACQKQTCGEDCGLYMIIIDIVNLPCGHTKQKVPCHLTRNLSGIKCDTLVEKQVPGCKHIVKVKCSQDVTTEYFRCPTPCTAQLFCTHHCSGTCGRCNTKVNGATTVVHCNCSKICGKRFGACNHHCRQTCHSGSDCGLCHNECEVRILELGFVNLLLTSQQVQCKHSKCKLKCHEACVPCAEPCTWSCEHQGSCTMPCGAPCNRLPCGKRCSKILPCGHQCPGLCGDNCPEKYCQACGVKADARVDILEFKEYRDIDLNETSVIFLNCGHFFTAPTLDGLIFLNEVYEMDGRTGEIIGLKAMPTQLAVKVPSCPDCNTPIRQYATQRYNRLINRAVIDQMTQRLSSLANKNYRNSRRYSPRLRQIFNRLLRLQSSHLQTRYRKIERPRFIRTSQTNYKHGTEALHLYLEKFALSKNAQPSIISPHSNFTKRRFIPCVEKSTLH